MLLCFKSKGRGSFDGLTQGKSGARMIFSCVQRSILALVVGQSRAEDCNQFNGDLLEENRSHR